jgi:threonine synthase
MSATEEAPRRAAGAQRLYERYARFMPQELLGRAVDIGQGFTPLVRSRSIGPKAGMPNLHFKLESLNPTGSYKDRFAGLAVGQAADAGRFVATSSGNTGAALAAFSAVVGCRCSLYVSENAPAGKLAQMTAYGADVFLVKRYTIDPAESARISQALENGAKERGFEIFTTAYAKSPLPMEGIKTIAYELHEDLGEIGDVFVPAGGGGLYVATCRGFEDLLSEGSAILPRVHIVQPTGNDTMAGPLRQGAHEARDVSTSTTISGLGVGNVLDGHTAIAHARRNGGTGHVIGEDRIREVQALLAREEGILVEPAGATSVAGLLDAAARGEPMTGNVVCLLTGHGFKDPATVDAMATAHPSRLIDRSQIEASLDI